MRPMTGRLFPHSVVFTTYAPAGRAASAGTALRCCVQEENAERVVRTGGLHPQAGAVILFPAPPVDTSSGARVATATNALGPTPAAQDTFDWQPAAGPPRRYQALGPASDPVGDGRMVEVPCLRIA